MSYFVFQGVQRAEITLDGTSAGVVEVHVEMRGKETSVEFRSDSQETRQVLEGNVSELKDTLARQGLVLTGVSIGTSGHGEPGPRNRQDLPWRHAQAQGNAVIEEVRLSGSASARPEAVIDLYV